MSLGCLFPTPCFFGFFGELENKRKKLLKLLIELQFKLLTLAVGLMGSLVDC